jgi:hypothetical protein
VRGRGRCERDRGCDHGGRRNNLAGGKIIRRFPPSPGKKFHMETVLEDNDGDEEHGTHHVDHFFHQTRGHASCCQGGGRDESDPPGESDHFPFLITVFFSCIGCASTDVHWRIFR